MSRALLLLAGAAIVLAALYLGLGGRVDSAALSSIGPGAASAALVGLLAGFVGAAIANRFSIGRRGDESLAERISALESARDGARARAASPPPPLPPPSVTKDGPAPERTFHYDTPRQAPQPRQEPAAPPPPRPADAPTPPPPPPPEPANAPALAPSPPPEPPRRPAVPNLNEISAAYSRIVSGQISRSAFADFFDGIGASGPVEIADGGSAIAAASGSESFLTCVNAGAAFLVFPSYDFIANQATQFATIASVPETVAAVFTLERGDGELILERPAIYEETETGLRRVEKGEIRGFGG